MGRVEDQWRWQNKVETEEGLGSAGAEEEIRIGSILNQRLTLEPESMGG
jgi:hypothetical protein